jgi:undecaprenyl-phosphate 4-deoxy-4-formamido-L-arabinose transferase
VPALAYTFARNPTEIIVEHEERAAGESKYSLYSLIRLNFDLVTGFSLVPLQFFSMMGILLSLAPPCWCGAAGAPPASAPKPKAVHPVRDCLLLHGRILFGIGLLGEYVGRIFQQVRARPRYVVQTILQDGHGPGGSGPSRMTEKRQAAR